MRSTNTACAAQAKNEENSLLRQVLVGQRGRRRKHLFEFNLRGGKASRYKLPASCMGYVQRNRKVKWFFDLSERLSHTKPHTELQDAACTLGCAVVSGDSLRPKAADQQAAPAW